MTHQPPPDDKDAVMGMDGRYYAKGSRVFKAPLRVKTETGSTISIGFPVCDMTDFVGADGAQFIADAMNAHEYGTPQGDGERT